MKNPTSMLQVALVWQGRILAYRLCGPRQAVTIGPSAKTLFTTPPVPGSENRFTVLAPQKPRGRYRLRLTAGLTGEVRVRGEKRTVAELLVSGAASADDAAIREIDFDPGDKAHIGFADAPGLQLQIRAVDPPRPSPARA